MITDRHNAPPHDFHANKAGKVGDYASGAHSSLPWRQFGWFIATTMLASFVLNEVWEMVQMSAFVETVRHSWTSTLGLCMRAAVGIVRIILGIYAAGALAAGDLGWGLSRRWNNYVTAAVLGLAYAALVERTALAAEPLVVHGAHARGARAWRGPVAATSNDTAASAIPFWIARCRAGRSATAHSL